MSNKNTVKTKKTGKLSTKENVVKSRILPRSAGKTFTGTVVSQKMDKTVVVKVDTFLQHPLYKKRVKRSKKYLVHSEKPLKVNQKITFKETKPISKHKKFIYDPA